MSDGLAQRLTTLTSSAVGALRDHPMPALTKLAEAQEQHLRGWPPSCKAWPGPSMPSSTTCDRSWGTRLRQMQADHQDGLEQQRAQAIGHAKDLRNEMVESTKLHLEQVRTIVDENLETTLERRLGERFRLVTERLELVSERLEQVHRGLGEVQSLRHRRRRSAARPGPGTAGRHQDGAPGRRDASAIGAKDTAPPQDRRDPHRPRRQRAR